MLGKLPDMWCMPFDELEQPLQGIYVGWAGWSFSSLARHKVLDENVASRAFRKNMDDRWKWYCDNGQETWEGCPYPNILFEKNPMLDEYGMCDHYQQILNRWPFLIKDEREYIIHLVPIKSNPDAKPGGFRPHKNGAYIGKHKAVTQYEYFDHSGVEMIYTYYIYRIPLPGEDLRWSCS